MVVLGKKEELLGEGTYSKVYRQKVNGRTHAIKYFITKYYYNDELQIFKAITSSNENIVKFIDQIDNEDAIVLELCKECYSKRKYSESTFVHELWQICNGMEKLHSLNITHRDLKPANILIGYDGKLKITDFSTSTIDIENDEFNKEPETTWYFAAPEIWNKKCQTEKIDVFAFAILIYWKLIDGITMPDGLWINSIKNGWRPNLDRFDEKYTQIIKMCWQQDPKLRPTFTELKTLLFNNTVHVTDRYFSCPTCLVNITSNQLDRHFDENHSKEEVDKSAEIVRNDCLSALFPHDTFKFEKERICDEEQRVYFQRMTEQVQDEDMSIVLFDDINLPIDEEQICGFAEVFLRPVIYISFIGVNKDKYIYPIIRSLCRMHKSKTIYANLGMYSFNSQKTDYLKSCLDENDFALHCDEEPEIEMIKSQK